MGGAHIIAGRGWWRNLLHSKTGKLSQTDLVSMDASNTEQAVLEESEIGQLAWAWASSLQLDN